ncbi:lytic polysaccharide monooxygenase [Phytohabitans suffuscus]
MSVYDTASAHGTMQAPPSRVYHCRFLDNPQAPVNPACRNAIALGGEQAVYDWNEVSAPHAAGNHRAVIPDGKLCSAGRAKYRGFDQPRPDWPATHLTAGASYDFRLEGSASHAGTVDLFITRDGYDPTVALRWDDLEEAPFLTMRADHAGGAYRKTGMVPPGKSGRHIIYAIWQRRDSPEAFYACSDVLFDGTSGPRATLRPGLRPGVTPPPAPAARPTVAPSVTPSVVPTAAPTVHPTATPWQPDTGYAAGATVSFGGRAYTARQAHTSQVGWEPPNVPALWLAAAEQGESARWQPQVAYAPGDHVTHGETVYMCRQADVAQPGWEPPTTPALWQPM